MSPSTMNWLTRTASWLLLITAALLFGGCGGGRLDVDDETSFLSHIPGRSGTENDSALDGDGGVGSEGPSSGAGGTASGTGGASNGGDDPQRLIAEADIIKLVGTTLYALSEFSGLSVIDTTNPRSLRLLGSYRTSAQPFEMYVEGARAYVMYNGWGTYRAEEDGSYAYRVSSRVQALDIADPAAIHVIGEQEVPGRISDSRKVGEVLYLVTHENSYCWGCDDKANSRVTSFDVSDPSHFTRIDQLKFVNADSYVGQRSISVTAERIYLSGTSWGWESDQSGDIEVVDISDAGGDLKKGATLQIAGPIQSRWQMDEFEGVLRVISQPGGWGNGAAPVIETFQVNSATSIEKLASLTMVLPRPEILQSVRFDGVRGYAVTFERTDPLFTIDLSDPAAPRQLGELEIPGWIYHMEPRGDRIYALGYDSTVAGDSLHVSLYDVSDLSTPVQLSRVRFGGDWGNFAEDQDRIHKAFTILPEAGLILVPFVGYGNEEGKSCSWKMESGIQLVDMTEDDLVLRGVAPQIGSAQRALLQGDVLLGVSDNAVQTFDLSDRDEPVALGRLDIARNTQSLRVMGDTMLRFGSDWWTGQTTLDFSRLDQVSQAEPLGNLDLGDLAGESSCNSSSYWDNQVFVHGSYAYVPLRSYDYSQDSYVQSIRFYVIDLRERTKPVVVGTFVVKTEDRNEYLSTIIQTDRALLVGRGNGGYWSNPWTGERSEVKFSYDVISLEEPAAPRVVSTLQVPSTLSSGGFGYGLAGCSIDMGWGWWGGYYWGYGYGAGAQTALVSGNIVASQHEEAVNDGTGRVRYYIDRIDVSDPERPRLLPSVNIPGSVVHFDAASGRVVTVDYLLNERGARGWEECNQGLSYFDSEAGVCREYRRRLNTLGLDGDVARRVAAAEIDHGGSWANQLAVTSSRVFFTKNTDEDPGLTVGSFGLARDGSLARLPDVSFQDNPWASLVARDDRAFLSTSGVFNVVDTSEAGAPTSQSFPMGGWNCGSLEVKGDTAYCALGQQGVQAFELGAAGE